MRVSTELWKKVVGVDLNLLKVFMVIDEVRHVTRAAKILGISQPALSHALNRLRLVMGDPLFIKTSQGMVPTHKASSISIPVRNLLTQLEREILAVSGPGAVVGVELRVACPDWIEFLLSPRLVSGLASALPKVKLEATRSFAAIEEDLASGRIDLAIVDPAIQPTTSCFREAVFKDTLIGAVRQEHPRCDGVAQLSLEALNRESHVVVAGEGWSARVDQVLAHHQLRRNAGATVTSVMAAAKTVSTSDLMLIGPSRILAELSSLFGLKLLALPLEMPTIELVQLWQEQAQTDPAHVALRKRVRSLLLDRVGTRSSTEDGLH